MRQLRDDPDAVVRFHETELKDGRTFEYFGSVIKGEVGAALGRIWFFRDITERKRSAEALAQSEARFKAIFDNARDGIALTDPETKKFLFGNAYLYRMLGYTAEEFVGLGMSDIHPAEAMPRVLEEFERHRRGDKRAATDIPVKRKDGSVFYVDINSAPVEIGGKRCVLGIFRDATARREAENAVRKSEERYRSLVESTTDYIWEIDQNGRYTYYTPAMTRSPGLRARRGHGQDAVRSHAAGRSEKSCCDVRPDRRGASAVFHAGKHVGRQGRHRDRHGNQRRSYFRRTTASSAVIEVSSAISPSASSPSNSSSNATRCCTRWRLARQICLRRPASTKRSRAPWQSWAEPCKSIA